MQISPPRFNSVQEVCEVSLSRSECRTEQKSRKGARLSSGQRSSFVSFPSPSPLSPLFFFAPLFGSSSSSSHSSCTHVHTLTVPKSAAPKEREGEGEREPAVFSRNAASAVERLRLCCTVVSVVGVLSWCLNSRCPLSVRSSLLSVEEEQSRTKRKKHPLINNSMKTLAVLNFTTKRRQPSNHFWYQTEQTPAREEGLKLVMQVAGRTLLLLRAASAEARG